MIDPILKVEKTQQFNCFSVVVFVVHPFIYPPLIVDAVAVLLLFAFRDLWKEIG